MKVKIEFVGQMLLRGIIPEPTVEADVADDTTLIELLGMLGSKYQGLSEKLLTCSREIQHNVFIYLGDEKIEQIQKNPKLSGYLNRNGEVGVTIYVLQAVGGGA